MAIRDCYREGTVPLPLETGLACDCETRRQVDLIDALSLVLGEASDVGGVILRA